MNGHPGCLVRCSLNFLKSYLVKKNNPKTTTNKARRMILLVERKFAGAIELTERKKDMRQINTLAKFRFGTTTTTTTTTEKFL